MISMLIALSAVTAPAPAATAPRTLQGLPGVTVHYYDVAGKDGDAIQKSMEKIMKAPAPNTAAQLYDWSLDVGINKRTEGTACTVTDAQAKLKGNVYLPRLASGDQVPKDVVTKFNAYEKSLEASASDNLWFVADRLPAIQQTLVGKTCDSTTATWTQATTNLVNEQKAFATAQAARAKTQKSGNDNERSNVVTPPGQTPTNNY